MIDLAVHTDEGVVQRQRISERQDVSVDYVAQLFRQLREAGLVEAVKGPGGGYRLRRDAGQITAGDVVRAVEGPVAVVHCTDPADEESCNRIDHCVTHAFWLQLSNTISRFMDSVTLEDLRDETMLIAALSRRDEGEALGEPLEAPASVSEPVVGNPTVS
jgi:Rrf2 family iron-sulfur cluster assembly transcriptional regulator